MGRIIDWILDAFYPTKCILCRKLLKPGRPSICPSCQMTLPLAEGIRRRGDYFSGCVSAVFYEGRMKEAILRYKFGDAEAYAPAFGELVAERIYSEMDGKYDLISWVPLAPDHLRKRGFDQAYLIARNAAERLRKPLVPVLKKKRRVKAQSGTKTREERRRNIAGAYTVIDPAVVKEKRILLIDDIITTGSTLSECAKTLLKAGAEDVVCTTLAMTPK